MPSEIEGLIFPYFFTKNRIFGCLGGILEASKAVLEKKKKWAVLGLNLGPTWTPRWLLSCPRAAREEPTDHP